MVYGRIFYESLRRPMPWTCPVQHGSEKQGMPQSDG